MAQLKPLQNQFLKMVRDTSRNRMPPNSCWNLIDILPDYEAPGRERGGWAHASASVSAVTSTASYIAGGVYAAFATSSGADNVKNLAVDEDGLLYSIATAGTVTLIGSARVIAQNPIFFAGTAASAAALVNTGLAIFPDSTAVAIPKKYDGTTISDLGGTPPKAKFGIVYKDFLALGNGQVGSTFYENRTWFSPAGDPDAAGVSATAWDTLDSWFDTNHEVVGYGATPNALIVFGKEQATRIRGDTPPPEENMVKDDGWIQVGLLDAQSIVHHENQVYWCAQEGVYRTDGVSLDDLTLKGQMMRYWLDLVADSTTAWTFSAGVIRGKMVISVMNAGTFVDAFLIDLSTYSWTRMSNVDARAMWSGRFNVQDDLYFGRREQAFVGRMDTIFEVDSATYKADGDGTAVASTIELPFHEMGKPGLKALRALFTGYSLGDFATDNPTFALSYTRTPEETSYTSLATVTEQGTYLRDRQEIGGRSFGVAVKLVRSGAGNFRLHDMSAEATVLEESKR